MKKYLTKVTVQLDTIIKQHAKVKTIAKYRIMDNKELIHTTIK